MERLKLTFFNSVMSYINLSIFTIIAVSLLSLFFSFWSTDQADHDVKSLNLAGSMRMQTFHIGLALKYDSSNVNQLIQKLDRTWNSSLFSRIYAENNNNKEIKSAFEAGYNHWFKVVHPEIVHEIKSLMKDQLNLKTGQKHDKDALYPLLEKQVQLTDHLANQFQFDAAAKIRKLRSFILLSLLVTTLVGSLIFYLLKNRIESPLSHLTTIAVAISQGDINQNIYIRGKDELSLLASTFNQMCQSIRNNYDELETRVAQRTDELKRKNKTLELLFDTARKTIEDDNPSLDYQYIINDLSVLLEQQDIELCLFTSRGQLPYLQVAPSQFEENHCGQSDCENCRSSAPYDAFTQLGFCQKYPIIREEVQYGVINVRGNSASHMEDWKIQLLRSIADQLAIALSLSEKKDQERRLAMLNERTVIARELHDSLAQSLSYLQIQVTRLQKCHDKEKYTLQQPIIDELREGLSSGYRHLRELLTTFRLKIDDGGLESALQQTTQQLSERSNMKINLDDQLTNIPLSPMEEIHLIQITREASQNAINHSKGEHLNISLNLQEDKSIKLVIQDDGIGLPSKPEKLNHYGLAIIKERSRHLNGKLEIISSPGKGTAVTVEFTPQYAKDFQPKNEAEAS